MEAVLDNWQIVRDAFVVTVALVVISGIGALVWGTILAAFRVSPVQALRVFGTGYVSLARNTPLLMFFLFFQLGAGKLWDVLGFTWVSVHIGSYDFTSFFAGAVAALTLYTSSFVCEGLRSGVNAVDLGQVEAARAIGLPFSGVLRRVVLPQAFRTSVPPVVSALIAMVKNSSLAGIFGVLELANRMKGLTNNHADQRTEIFLVFALLYIVIVAAFSIGAATLERRWKVAR